MVGDLVGVGEENWVAVLHIGGGHNATATVTGSSEIDRMRCD